MKQLKYCVVAAVPLLWTITIQMQPAMLSKDAYMRLSHYAERCTTPQPLLHFHIVIGPCPSQKA